MCDGILCEVFSFCVGWRVPNYLLVANCLLGEQGAEQGANLLVKASEQGASEQGAEQGGQ